MKTTMRHIVYYLLLGMMITSCSMIDDDMPEQFNETTSSVSKQVDLLVSIGTFLSIPVVLR